jgi:predicted RNase H-like HicB family nuclease
MRVLNVCADWDGEAGVWVVTSDDIPGLVTEAETAEQVTAKLRDIVPELIRENGLDHGTGGELPVEVTFHQRLALHAACTARSRRDPSQSIPRLSRVTPPMRS